MSRSEPKPAFLRRFDGVWSRQRRTTIGQALCWTALAILLGFTLLTAADYAWELPWNVRAGALGALGFASLGLAALLIAGAVRRWSRPKTAEEIERRFPELGQSIRTAVQFGGRPEDVIQAEGVAATLVDALEEDADARTQPLPLETIVPLRRLATAAGVTFAAVVFLVVAAAVNWEWRRAASRALLGDQPYTRLAVSPGNVTIDEKQSLIVAFDVLGRPRRDVRLFTRPANQADEKWTERKLSEKDRKEKQDRKERYEVALTDLKEPLEYRVAAGPAASDVYRVEIRYPLAIKSIQVEVTPPEYTGIPPTTVKDGQLQVIDGSLAVFRIELDRRPQSAEMILSELGRSKQEAEASRQVIPLEIDGTQLTTQLTLTEDRVYSIAARAADGVTLPDNKHRIRVRNDQPPQVWFESPNEALEVHSLAEILMRVRARDDFGLSKAGIVFQVNNEDEYELLAEDYQAAVEELKETGRLTPRTQAALEKVLPLEHFALTQKDSVAYYAFAEDNFPAGPRRVESDLRFIDIRPFRRTYRVIDPEMGNSQGERLATLDELIARQRFVLNRTIRLEQRAEKGEQIDLPTIDKLMEFQGEIAQFTQRLAQFLESLEFDGADLLYQAESSMLAAVDSLSVGKYDNAVLQEKDALRYLIEGRDKVQIAILKNPRSALAQLQNFDRTQAQKLRRPKSDEEEAQEAIQRLEQLAEEQDFVYETLAGIIVEGETPPNSQQQPKTQVKQKPKSKSSGSQSGEGQGSQSSGEPKEPNAEVPKEPNEGASAEQATENPGAKQEGEPKEGGSKEPGDDQGQGVGEREKGEEGRPEPMTREELEQKQLDIALEAHDIERILQRLEGVTELARSRMQEAARTADEVSGALARGNTEESTEAAEDAAAQLREVARNVRGVLQPEAAQRIAAARDLSNRLAQLQRELGDQTSQLSQGESSGDGQRGKTRGRRPGEGENGAGEEGEGEIPADELAEKAERLAETGKTVMDILESVQESFDPAEQEAVRRVDEMLREGEIHEIVQRMENLPPVILARRWPDVQVQTADVADRLEVTAQQLDTLHRRVVAPQAEQLRELEQEMVRLQERLDRLDANAKIGQWHREAAAVLEELEEAGVGAGYRDDLLEAMTEAGWGERSLTGDWGWAVGGNGYYTAPVVYRRNVRLLTEELQQRIQELVLGDLQSSEDEPVPPNYEPFVERYMQVLSAEGKD